MAGIYEKIKKAVHSTLSAMDLVAYEVGEVVSVNPLVVKVGQRKELDQDFLELTESVKEIKLDLTHFHNYEDTSDSGNITKQTESALTEEIIVRRALAVNDKVHMLKIDGGKYLIIDRVVV